MLTDIDADVTKAAHDLAGNWKSFDSFDWLGEPDQDSDDYAIVYLSNRDSGCLDKSNEAAILGKLKPWIGWIGDGDDVEEQSHNHWACGYVDGIVIRCLRDGKPTDAFTKLHELAMALADYPVLDEEDYSARQQEAADETWRGCYTDRERIEYIRRNPNQFEFKRFADMLACVRGKFFAGYASELIQE
jgi:hypothetical protein